MLRKFFGNNNENSYTYDPNADESFGPQKKSFSTKVKKFFSPLTEEEQYQKTQEQEAAAEEKALDESLRRIDEKKRRELLLSATQDVRLNAYQKCCNEMTAIWDLSYTKAQANKFNDNTCKEKATIALLKEGYIGGTFDLLQWRTFSKPVANMVRDFEDPNMKHYTFDRLLEDLLALKQDSRYNPNGRLGVILLILNDKSRLKQALSTAEAELMSPTLYFCP
jgi:hypothetical protein